MNSDPTIGLAASLVAVALSHEAQLGMFGGLMARSALIFAGLEN